MEYQLIDSGHFEKLEQVGRFRIVRPSPQAVWAPAKKKAEWQKVDARFDRFSGGDGDWTVNNPAIRKPWSLKVDELNIEMQLTDFGHLGIFAEQLDNWRHTARLIKEARRPIKVLNLFAYTGIQTLYCALAGADVVHLDASKTSVSWGRKNAELSGLTDRPIRWIVDDVQKFVAREIRRESQYDAIILDPPSFGRGAKGQVWKIEEHLIELLKQLKLLISNNPLFFMLCSHSNGYTPRALQNLLLSVVEGLGGQFHTREMLVPEKDKHRLLPSGASCLFEVSRS